MPVEGKFLQMQFSLRFRWLLTWDKISKGVLSKDKVLHITRSKSSKHLCKMSISRRSRVEILHATSFALHVPLLLRLSPLSVVLITINCAMEGHVHGPCVQCCLGQFFRIFARKAVNGAESRVGAPDSWMFSLFGSWLFKRASSNEFVKRFQEKTSLKFVCQACNDVHKLPTHSNLPGILPKSCHLRKSWGGKG